MAQEAEEFNDALTEPKPQQQQRNTTLGPPMKKRSNNHRENNADADNDQPGRTQNKELPSTTLPYICRYEEIPIDHFFLRAAPATMLIRSGYNTFSLLSDCSDFR